MVCVAVTTNLALADAPGNVLLEAHATGLPRDSVANVTQIITVDRGALIERAGIVPATALELVLTGIELVLRRG